VWTEFVKSTLLTWPAQGKKKNRKTRRKSLSDLFVYAPEGRTNSFM